MQQEIDLLELGRMPARCLKGENGPKGHRIVRGRAGRALREAQRRGLMSRVGGRTAWLSLDEQRIRSKIAAHHRTRNRSIARIKALEREDERPH